MFHGRETDIIGQKTVETKTRRDHEVVNRSFLPSTCRRVLSDDGFFFFFGFLGVFYGTHPCKILLVFYFIFKKDTRFVI